MKQVLRHIPVSPLRALGAIITLGSVALVSSSCSGTLKPPLSESTAPAEILVALDMSGSARRSLPAYIQVVSKCHSHLPSSAWLQIVGFDSRIATVRSGPVPHTRDALSSEMVSVLERWPKSSGGTRFDELLPDLAERADRCPGKVVIMIESDMLPDSVTNAGLDRMRFAAARLARNPRVTSVAIVGADVRASATVERAFGPLIPKKLARYNLEAVDAEAIAGGLR